MIADPANAPANWDDSDPDDERTLLDLGVTYIEPLKNKKANSQKENEHACQSKKSQT